MGNPVRSRGGGHVSPRLKGELEALGEMVEQLVTFTRARSPSGADVRWLELDRQTDGQISGRRILVVGTGIREDASGFAARGAAYVLGCESPPAPERSRRSSDGSGVALLQLSWQELDPVEHGTFDVVHCDGLLHRVTDPLLLLRTLRSMMVPEGTLLLRSMVLTDPERSEYLRFVPDRFAGDPSWQFVPGRLAFRWLVQTAGFDVLAEFGEWEGPRDLVPVAAVYLKAIARR